MCGQERLRLRDGRVFDLWTDGRKWQERTRFPSRTLVLLRLDLGFDGDLERKLNDRSSGSGFDICMLRGGGLTISRRYTSLHMRVQIASFREGLPASWKRAHIRFFASMASIMNLKCVRPQKRRSALFAHIRSTSRSLSFILPFVRMSSGMIFKMAESSELLATAWIVALIRLFASMDPKVSVEVAFLRKGLPTRRTREGLFASLELR